MQKNFSKKSTKFNKKKFFSKFDRKLLPNGHLVSGSNDKTIKIWNTNEGVKDDMLS